MQPSSLIFLVIVAIWAAYLIQHWVRRREHAATARSVDRFSEAMRVLERRSPLPRSELSTPHPPSYAVSPARPARPAVVVKRSPLVARSSLGRPPGSVTARVPDPATNRAPGGRAASRPHAASRRTRGIALLTALALLPVSVLLCALHLLPWVVVAGSVSALSGVLVWLRSAASAQRSARGTGSRRGRPRSMPDSGAAPADGSRPAASAPALGSWTPVPVPRPTYALKDQARRTEPGRALDPRVPASETAGAEPTMAPSGDPAAAQAAQAAQAGLGAVASSSA